MPTGHSGFMDQPESDVSNSRQQKQHPFRKLHAVPTRILSRTLNYFVHLKRAPALNRAKTLGRALAKLLGPAQKPPTLNQNKATDWPPDRKNDYKKQNQVGRKSVPTLIYQITVKITHGINFYAGLCDGSSSLSWSTSCGVLCPEYRRQRNSECLHHTEWVLEIETEFILSDFATLTDCILWIPPKRQLKILCRRNHASAFEIKD